MGQNRKIAPHVSYIMGSISVALSIVLLVGIGLLSVKMGTEDIAGNTTGIVVVSMALSFAIFFLFIAFRTILSAKAHPDELATVRGWRLLALCQVIIGVAGGLLGHWIAILVPAAIAIICMIKDPKFVEILRAIGLGAIGLILYL